MMTDDRDFDLTEEDGRRFAREFWERARLPEGISNEELAKYVARGLTTDPSLGQFQDYFQKFGYDEMDLEVLGLTRDDVLAVLSRDPTRLFGRLSDSFSFGICNHDKAHSGLAEFIAGMIEIFYGNISKNGRSTITRVEQPSDEADFFVFNTE